MAHVASLFLELANCTLLRCLIRVHKAGGNFNDGLVDGRTPLFLKEDSGLLVWICWVLKDGDDTDAIDVAALGASESLC